MRRLILMRHAKSDWGHSGLADRDRPLNRRGRKSARLLGRWLSERGFRPDEVLCSPALRTRETLDGLGLADVAIRFLSELYLAEPETMLQALRDARGEAVLMLGHNPGIGTLAGELLATPPAHERFADYPTGATLVADFDGADWPSALQTPGTAVDFAVPRDLSRWI